MKYIAVLSDIHGNLDALKAVITQAQQLGCEEYLCCGDFAGYYYQANEVISYIRQLKITAVIGNHDVELLRLRDGKTKLTNDYIQEFGSALELALNDRVNVNSRGKS